MQGSAWHRGSAQETSTPSSSASPPLPQHAHSVPGLPEIQEFHWGLNRHRSRYFFTEKSKEKGYPPRPVPRFSPVALPISSTLCSLWHAVLTCGQRAWPRATSTLAWEVWSTDCLWSTKTLHDVWKTKSLICCAGEQHGRVEWGVS